MPVTGDVTGSPFGACLAGRIRLDRPEWERDIAGFLPRAMKIEGRQWRRAIEPVSSGSLNLGGVSEDCASRVRRIERIPVTAPARRVG